MKRLLAILVLLSATSFAQIAAWVNGGTAGTPTFSPGAGAVSNPTTVTITSPTSACNSYIHHNTTGSPVVGDPTGTYSVTGAVTLYAKVISCPGYADSAVGSAAYTISGGGSAPTIVQWNGNSGTDLAVASLFQTSGGNNTTDIVQGHAILCTGYSFTNDVTALTDQNGRATFTKVVARQAAAATGQKPFAFFASNVTAGAVDIRQTGGTGAIAFQCIEFAGASAVDTYSTDGSGSTTATITPTGAAMLISLASADSTSLAVPAGWTCNVRGNNDVTNRCPQGGFNFNVTAGYKSVASGGLVTYTSPVTSDILVVAVKQ